MLPLLTQVTTALSTYDAGDSSSDAPPLHSLTVTTMPVSLHLSSHIHFQQLNCTTPLLKRTDRLLTGDNLPNHHWKLFFLNTNHSQDPRDAEAGRALCSHQCPSRDTQSRVPSTTSRRLLKGSKEETPQPLGSLCQGSVICTAQKCFLTRF